MRLRDEIRKLEAMDLGLTSGSVTPRRLAAADSYARNAEGTGNAYQSGAQKAARASSPKSTTNRGKGKKPAPAGTEPTPIVIEGPAARSPSKKRR